MSDRKIKMTIDGFGRPKIEAVGFAGQDCTTATGRIEAALGGKAVQELKPEYYETLPEQTEQVYEG